MTILVAADFSAGEWAQWCLELAMTARPGMPWPDGSRLVDMHGVVRAVLVPWVGGGAWCHVFEDGGRVQR